MKLSLNDPKLRSFVTQCVIVGGVFGLGWYLVGNTVRNLELRGIATGFGFLWREAGLPIAEAPIAFAPTDNYARALLIGVLNTLKIAVIGIAGATILGTLIGIGRLSRNWLVAKVCAVYVELLRGLPLLLQLLLWYAVLKLLPAPRAALHPLTGVYLSNRGLVFPAVPWDDRHAIVLAAAIFGAALLLPYKRWANGAHGRDGIVRPLWTAVLALVVGVPAITWWAVSAPATLELPVLQGFNFRGGLLISPEFFALLLGLVTYTGAFIAEIVRSGLIAVSHGQWEAARALGLSTSLILRKVILPQAFRIVVPPMTSQFLNLTKNSSLAVAIGFQDIVSIANTTLNQTGQAVEGVAIIMAVYLTISLSISLFMNWFDGRMRLKDR